MRKIIITLGLLPMALLAGCGQAEQAALSQLRTQMADQCKSQMGAGGAEQATKQGIDPDRFCACLADKSLAGKSVEDLSTIGAEGSAEAGAQAGLACRAEQLGGARGGAPAPAGEQAKETDAEVMEEAAGEAARP